MSEGVDVAGIRETEPAADRVLSCVLHTESGTDVAAACTASTRRENEDSELDVRGPNSAR